jgi:hypothetical protein
MAESSGLKNPDDLLPADQRRRNADLQTKEADLALEREKLASTERIEFAKLAQQRELELLKIGMAETDTLETDDEGKPVKKPADHTTAMLMDGLNRLGDMVGGLAAHLSAPTEIVRGPDGRAVGTRKKALN